MRRSTSKLLTFSLSMALALGGAATNSVNAEEQQTSESYATEEIITEETIDDVTGQLTETTEEQLPERDENDESTSKEESDIHTESDADSGIEQIEGNEHNAKYVEINATNFPDDEFRKYLKMKFDRDGDNKLDANSVDWIDVSEWEGNIYSLQGIEIFTNLKKLYCGETKISVLDLSKSNQLEDLSFYDTYVKSIDLSNCTQLERIQCENANLSVLDVSNCVKLKDLGCSNMCLKKLVLGDCSQLEGIGCNNTLINSLDLSKCTNLKSLNCSDTLISSLDLSKCTSLTDLSCSNTLINSLDLSKCTGLKYLHCDNTKISSLNINNCKEINYLFCDNTNIDSLDLSNAVNLENLSCSNTKLNSLDINNTKLLNLNCSDTNISSLGLSNAGILSHLDCSNTNISNLDLDNCNNLCVLNCSNTNISNLDLDNCKTLSQLNCSDTKISSLDLSNNKKIWEIDCSNTNISNLDLNNCEKLWILKCNGTKISSLDLSKFDMLTNLYCYDTNIKSSDDIKLSARVLTMYIDESMIINPYNFVNDVRLCIFTDKAGYVNLKNIIGIDSALNYSGYDKSTGILKYNPQISWWSDWKTEYWVTRDHFDENYKISYMIIYSDNFDEKNITGIYVAQMDKNGIVAGMAYDSKGEHDSYVYQWYASKDDGKTWICIDNYVYDNEWISWKPDEWGDYILVCKMRCESYGNLSKEITASTNVSYHPHIKGKCQMPYEGPGGGYLIGVESYDNPNQSYKYEMLVLDCTLLAQGKDAWIYTTGKCGVSEGNALWTIWQPQYGYYWTLFRIYDQYDNLIDQECYGFANAY